MSRFERMGGIATGRDVEVAVLGKSSIAGLLRAPEYLPRAEAVATLLNVAPLPAEAMPVFAREFVTHVTRAAYKAGLGHIKFRSALGTSLDIHHGVDALFATQQNAIVTLDVTSNDEKVAHKADLIVHVQLDSEGNIIFSDERLRALTTQIIALLKKNTPVH